MGLLAILSEGAAHGYHLRAEFERRTGATWPVNIGQVYTTLDRLERDGLVIRDADTDEGGQRRYTITDAGRDETRGWLMSPIERADGTRDELPIKLALATTLPGVDVVALVDVQRRSSLGRLQRLTTAKRSAGEAASHEEFAWQLVIDGLIFEAEAELRWLDHVETRVNAVVPDGLLPATTMSDSAAAIEPTTQGGTR